MSLLERVTQAIEAAPILDLHTHLFAPQLKGMNLSGVDELLTYHYLIAEVLRVEPVSPEWLFAQPTAAQADLIWDALFVRRTPFSEATVGVTHVLSELGLDPAAPNLKEAREYFLARTESGLIDDILGLTKVRYVTMTNDPLHDLERQGWESGEPIDPRFLAALRIDPIVNGWHTAVAPLNALGYDVTTHLTESDITLVRNYFADWIQKMNPRYMAISLPDTFTYSENSTRGKLLAQAVLPTCREHGLPFAMMIGVRRQVNPRLQGAGDGVGCSDISAVERMAEENPGNRLMVTVLARENQQALCVAARKFANILPFGCWWFMNNPSLVEETTLMRLEMLGPSFVPQHSDARILEQLIYKWAHARTSISAALAQRYEALAVAGRHITDEEINRDANALMGGIAAQWLGIEW